METWATPVLNAPVTLAPGETLDVPIPLGPFFALAPGRYRVSAEYGDDKTRAAAEARSDPALGGGRRCSSPNILPLTRVNNRSVRCVPAGLPVLSQVTSSQTENMCPVGRTLVSPVFIGRDAELATLTTALESAVAGTPTVVLLGGEAGVGKTRLVEEAAARARAAGARVLAGSCIELGGEGLAVRPARARVAHAHARYVTRGARRAARPGALGVRARAARPRPRRRAPHRAARPRAARRACSSSRWALSSGSPRTARSCS